MQVLGLPPNADSGRVEQKYKMLKSQAERDGNKELAQQIEGAHSSIFMSSLSSRLAGSGPKDKKVRFADRQRTVPWLPRVTRASPFVMKLAVAVQAATFIWQMFIAMVPSPKMVPVIGSVLTIYKIYQLNPPGGDQQKRIEGNMRNIVRGLIIAALATFAGIIVFWSGPSLLCQQVLGYLPPILADHAEKWSLGGMCICNALATIFFQ